MMTKLIIGVDISKASFAVAGLRADGKESFAGSYAMDREGFNEFLERITAHSPDLQEVLVGMESTGCYQINLFSFLSSQGIRAVVINPLLIANYAKLSLRKTKTDKKDARTIAKFLLDHEEGLSQLSLSENLQDFRDLARERESVSHLLSATKVEIKRVLGTIFPELEYLGDVTTGVMLRLLQAYPSARRVKVAKPKALAKVLKHPGSGHQPSFSAEDILQAARNSIATASPAKEIILQGKIATLLHLQERLEEMTRLLTELCQKTRLEDFKILQSIRGVGPNTAASFLAEMGTVEDFPSYKKLIAFAGLDPSLHQSGKFVGKSKISKRGNRHLRRAIYLMAASVASQNPFFKSYFIKRKKEGLAPQKALFAVAHKLIRVIYVMLCQRTYFMGREAL
jgi:transposase